jgi:Tfp pilus assembly protein PilV
MSLRSGVSLIECIVALMLLALGVIGATMVTLTALRMEREARVRAAVLRATIDQKSVSYPFPAEPSDGASAR